METCKTPLPKVSSANEVAGGGLKKFPERLYAVPPQIANGLVEGVTAESFEEDNKLLRKHVLAYKRINKLIGTTRYRNIMDMNARLGGFAAALESPKSWVMNVVPTIAKNTLGVIYERGLVGIYHDWYALLNLISLFLANSGLIFSFCLTVRLCNVPCPSPLFESKIQLRRGRFEDFGFGATFHNFWIFF